MKTWVFALAAAALTVTCCAQAQNAPDPAPAGQGVRAACAADFNKFCSDVQPGGGRIRACIAEHKDDLSPGCRDALQQARAHRPQPDAGGQQTPSAPPPPKPQTN
jgi:hypothetical protein